MVFSNADGLRGGRRRGGCRGDSSLQMGVVFNARELNVGALERNKREGVKLEVKEKRSMFANLGRGSVAPSRILMLRYYVNSHVRGKQPSVVTSLLPLRTGRTFSILTSVTNLK